MCLAIPGKIIDIKGHQAKVKYPNEERNALVGNDPVKKGDWVMVQMGIVIKILTGDEVKQTVFDN